MKRALVALLGVVGCTAPAVPTSVDGTSAAAEVLGVTMRNVRVYAVRDNKRNATCWVAVTGTGGDVSIWCAADHVSAAPTPTVAPAASSQPPSPPATTSGTPAKQVEAPVLSPVPPIRGGNQ